MAIENIGRCSSCGKILIDDDWHVCSICGASYCESCEPNMMNDKPPICSDCKNELQ
jgi:hypothetical protein